jgi:hypothetical protein
MEQNPYDKSIQLSFSERAYLPPDKLQDAWQIDESHILLGAVMQAREMLADLNPGDFPTYSERVRAQAHRAQGIGILDNLLRDLVPLVPIDIDEVIKQTFGDF